MIKPKILPKILSTLGKSPLKYLICSLKKSETTGVNGKELIYGAKD